LKLVSSVASAYVVMPAASATDVIVCEEMIRVGTGPPKGGAPLNSVLAPRRISPTTLPTAPAGPPGVTDTSEPGGGGGIVPSMVETGTARTRGARKRRDASTSIVARPAARFRFT